MPKACKKKGFGSNKFAQGFNFAWNIWCAGSNLRAQISREPSSLRAQRRLKLARDLKFALNINNKNHEKKTNQSNHHLSGDESFDNHCQKNHNNFKKHLTCIFLSFMICIHTSSCTISLMASHFWVQYSPCVC